MLLSFDRLRDGNGVEIVDHVERRQCKVQTPNSIELSDVDDEEFHFPVDQGIAFETESLTLPHRIVVNVRNSLGLQIREFTKDDSEDLPTDHYSIDLTAPIKLYLEVDSNLAVDVTAEEAHFDFGERVQVLLGARSYHKHPAATITTTDDPEDVMEALSGLGSALKTTTVERSYPTLRGHPPMIELGDELHIPESLNRPDTGVTIEVPRDLQHIFVVAPLAYYLGAKVEPGPVPVIRTEAGFEHALDDPVRGFEGEVERVLKQVFFLDCLTRTEGYYPVNLHERNVLKDELNLDFGELYDTPLSEQIKAYLDIPFAAIEAELPDWQLTAHVSMVPENIEILSFFINDLAVVQSPSGQQLGREPSEISASSAGQEIVRAGDFTRSASSDVRASAETANSPTLVRPEEASSLEQAWVGEGAPVGASKAMLEAYKNRLDRTPTDNDIEITVICNDTAMNDERDIVDDIYGSREELPFDVNGYHELSVDKLRAVIRQDCHFLHYIGHIDKRGFECSDGFLDAATLEHTGVDAFLLNACTSYQQGMELIRAGSIAGVVTVEDVINSGAERIGSSLAKLLNHGFPFGAALGIARNQSIVGAQYLILGDSGIDIAQSESGVPGLAKLAIGETNRLIYHTYPTLEFGIGSIAVPYAGDNSEFYLAGGESGEFNLTDQELVEFLSIETQPLLFEGQLYWTDEIQIADFQETD